MSFVIHSELLFRQFRQINIVATQAEIENRGHRKSTRHVAGDNYLRESCPTQ